MKNLGLAFASGGNCGDILPALGHRVAFQEVGITLLWINGQ